jgi:hypothetical protein
MNAVTPRYPMLLKLETGFIFLLALAIFLSKPMIYLSILLLIGVALVRIIKDQDYRHVLFDNKLFWASIGVFVLGVISAAIGSSHIEDVGWMARKTILLPMVVPLLMAFTHKKNRTVALTGAVLGFWIAFLLTANMYNWSWNGDRYEGATWSVDGWGVVCAMLIVLLTPLAFLVTINLKWRIVLFLTLLGAVFMLITTGARGPWLGVIASVFVYLAVKQRAALLIVALLGSAILFAANNLWTQQVEAFMQRAQSIANVQTDASNYIRLALWETGSELIIKQLTSGEVGFWFGNGNQGLVEPATNFYRNEFSEAARIRPGLLKETIIDDFHNMYIQSIYQNGGLWTLSSLSLLIWITLGKVAKNLTPSSKWIAMPSFLNFLVIGITYTLLPHFAFLFLIFFVTLGRGFESS